MLEIKHLSYRVQDEAGAAEILRDVNLTIADKRFVVVTGPNGGGKTTLARAIMGINPATSGSIVWNGQDITALSVTERARLGISYGFQQPPRFKGIRVKDLLTIASGQKFLPRGEACKYLTQVGLCAADYLDREVDASLSGGEVKRIEIATILARQPQLMILDEPEAGIDLWSFARLTETFEEIHTRQDCTMVIISHQERIISLADEILVIDKGVIARRGTRDEVFTDIVHSTTGGCPVIYGEAKK